MRSCLLSPQVSVDIESLDISMLAMRLGTYWPLSRGLNITISHLRIDYLALPSTSLSVSLTLNVTGFVQGAAAVLHFKPGPQLSFDVRKSTRLPWPLVMLGYLCMLTAASTSRNPALLPGRF